MMDRVDAAALAFKLAGIYVIVQAVKVIPDGAVYLHNLVGAETVRWRDVLLIGAPVVIACSVLAVLGYLLIAWSRRFGARSLREPTQESIDFGGEAADLQAVAFSVFGLVLLVAAVPVVVTQVIASLENHDHLWSYLKTQAADLIVLFLQISAGYWLFLAPRAVRRAWEWLGGRLGDEKAGDR
jgi:hypothetical protein